MVIAQHRTSTLHSRNIRLGTKLHISTMSPREINEMRSIRIRICQNENKTLDRSHKSLHTSEKGVTLATWFSGVFIPWSKKLHTGSGSVVGRDVVVFVDIDLDAAVAARRDAAALGAAEGDGDDTVDVGEQDGYADRHHEARYDG